MRASTSSQEPGKRTTPNFTPPSSSLDHLVVLDQGIGQQALAHLRHLRGVLHVQLDQPAHVHVGDSLEAECGQGAFHGLPLRVEDARLRPDQHTRPHAERSSHASNGSPVMRS